MIAGASGVSFAKLGEAMQSAAIVDNFVWLSSIQENLASRLTSLPFE